MRLSWLWLILMAGAALAADRRLSTVDVTGEGDAVVHFRFDAAPKDLPRITVKDNVVDLLFAAASLPPDQPKLDVSAPHVLVSRISLFDGGPGKVRARVIVNGSPERLKERLQLSREGGAVAMKIAMPTGHNATLALLREEQRPLAEEAAGLKPRAAGFRWTELLVPFVMLCFVGAGIAGAVRFLRRKGTIGGSRKYLVEQLSYCPVGPGQKAGVCLLKVGQDFVLVGVTATQVTMLSNLPALAETYREESRLERESFQAAVEQEVKRLRGTKEYSA